MQTNQILHPFENLSLWNYFVNRSGATKPQIALIEKHVEQVIPLLNEYVKAFPIYTLHNLKHQQNIIRLMGELLGDDLNKLSSLECGILILSAVYHDIGMVFTDKELTDVAGEEEFGIFLTKNTKAQLIYEQNNKQPTSNLIGWYCRWAHAKRVWYFLNKIDSTIGFNWGVMPFKEELGFVCESHNEAIEYIKDDAKFNSNFLANCDLKFCAILLRLADILDFDNTRSPISVYEYLGIDQPKNQAQEVSRDEWNKHLHSEGFIFDRGEVFTLLFKAAPPHPYIEAGIRSFLRIIEEEFFNCGKLLKYCSPKWSSFALPLSINTDNLKSKNYRSGNYRFNLSEGKILNLLTGEGLYNDEFVFIRELLQNAIDTSRHREFIERLSNPQFNASPIQVSSFIDESGYQWIEIDDYGMGMNHEIIANHLLRKGESYYNSDRFKLDKLLIKEKTQVDFVPISRFGIGLLSCFIAGDKIEMNTRYFNRGDATENDSFRLTVEGRDGFFVLRSKGDKHIPSKMPNNKEVGYRKDFGTSVAVRVMTAKEFLGFDLRQKLEQYITCSPVPIKLNEHFIGGDFYSIVNQPWSEESIIDVHEDFVKQAEILLDMKLPNGIQVHTVPINLTSQSANRNLKGQLLFIILNMRDIPRYHRPTTSFSLKETNNSKLELVCIKKYKEGNQEKETAISHDLSSILDLLSIPKKATIDLYDMRQNSGFGKILLSHNGISIQPDHKRFGLNNRVFNKNFEDYGPFNRTFIYSGIVYFQDDLLPDLTVSRNEIKGLSFDIITHLLYSSRRLNDFIEDRHDHYRFFDNLTNWDTYFTTKIIHASSFYENNKDFWDNQEIFDSSAGLISVSKAKRKIKEYGNLLINARSIYSNTYNALCDYILEKNFSIEMILKKNENGFIGILSLKEFEDDAEQFENFEPALFVDFVNSKGTVHFIRINKSHPLINWYSKSYEVLHRDFYYYSRQMIFCLDDAGAKPSKKIKEVNTILNRLRLLLPTDAQPPIDLNLSEKDFEISIE